MRMATGILVALGLVFPALISSAADEGSRPPGVLARDWVRISERLGFVVTQTDGGSIPGNGAQVLRAAPEMVGADLTPPLKGYFVIRTPTGWRQIVMAEPVVMGQ